MKVRVQAAAIGAALGMSVTWMAACRSDHPQSAGAAAEFEPLFQRIVILPGNDPTVFPVAIEGAQLIEIDRTGALLAHYGPHVKRQPAPRAYQDIDGHRREVSVRFEIVPAGDPRMTVGAYDHASPLVIEPRP